MTSGTPSEIVLANPLVTRIHALWDELADFGADETDAAVEHAMLVLGLLVVRLLVVHWTGLSKPTTERGTT